MFKTIASVTAALLLAFVATYTRSGEVADADAARKKPLQRCDQLSDKAEIECLQKARERIVDARRKRESAAKGDDNSRTVRGDTAPLPSPTPTKR